MDDTLLARWLDGTLTDAEREALEKHPDYPAFSRIIAATDRLQAPDAETERLWQKLKAALEPAAKNNLQAKPSGKRWIWYSAAAAIAAVIVFLWWPHDSGPMIVQTGIGEQKTVTLPDSSLVKMNASSELRVETAGWSESRQVNLKGEAFFDVRKNPDAPFLVSTSHGKVTVLGTTFSVLDREKLYEVSCYRGLVKTESTGQTMEVPTGDKISTSGDGTWTFSMVNEGDVPAWIRGKSAFSNATLPVVIDELERQYDIKVDNKITADKHFTGAFPNNDLNLALDIICKSLDLKYQANGNNIVLEEK